MTITEVENMDAGTLKAKRAEAVEAVKGAPELAARYVQARLDATTRDEKLGEQGKTITALQDAAEASKKREADLRRTLETACADALAAGQAHESKLARVLEVTRTAATSANEMVESLTNNLADLQSECAEEKTQRAEAEALAKSRRAVLAQITGLIAPLLVQE